MKLAMGREKTRGGRGKKYAWGIAGGEYAKGKTRHEAEAHKE